MFGINLSKGMILGFPMILAVIAISWECATKNNEIEQIDKLNYQLHTKITQMEAIVEDKNQEVSLCSLYNSTIQNQEAIKYEENNGSILIDTSKF